MSSRLDRDAGRDDQTDEAVTGRRRRNGSGIGAPDALVSVGDLAKFTAAVALAAIFVDAALGHALLWENDPYWTYWITKTFLLATIFGLGTAWLGIGAGRGAVITLVHTLVLTVYYWSLSPVGLPSHPEWLDLEHTWVTGVPVHFGVLYLGYLLTLWLWRRRPLAMVDDGSDRGEVARTAGVALGAAVGIVVVGGGLASLGVGDFPGVTWYLVRLLLTVPFLIAWWALAGRDRVAAVAGGLTLAFVWSTYGHFLGPSGLPDLPLRLFEQAPPEATVAWLSYRETWLIAFPIVAAVSIATLFALSRPSATANSVDRQLATAAGGVLIVGVVLGAVAWAQNKPGGELVQVSSRGDAQVERGDFYGGQFEPATGQLDLAVRDLSPRVSPLPPHDEVRLVARVEHPDGRTFEVRADQPMVEDPLGRHGTWWGVGLHRWHHGDSGIGTDKLPAIRSEVAVFALGTILEDGRPLAAGIPVHVMTAHDGLPGDIELDVGDETTPIPGVPDGHLRVVWEEFSGRAGQGAQRARNALGTGLVVGLLALLGLAIRRDNQTLATR